MATSKVISGSEGRLVVINSLIALKAPCNRPVPKEKRKRKEKEMVYGRVFFYS